MSKADSPIISTKTIAVKLKPKAEKFVKQGHPWVFENSISKANKDGENGDLAVIFDQRTNSFLACGYWDEDSPIRIKVLHFGKPTKLNQDWYNSRVEGCYGQRAGLLLKETNGYRLIFGENDGLPGVICDVYAGIAVLKLYSNMWWAHLSSLLTAIENIISPSAIVLRTARKVGHEHFSDGDVLSGELPNEEVVFLEHGIQFKANVIHGHKTGFFLDHRANRKRVGEISKGKRVLDVFSYAGGFSVHALAGGATSVTSLDISKQALNLAKRNAEINAFSGEHHLLCGDAFNEMANLKGKAKYDIVIIDPPSFAKQASEVEGAIKAYKRLIKTGLPLVEKGGVLVMASCSSRVDQDTFFQLVESALTRSGRSWDLLSRWGHDQDHPIGFPEGAYLKCGFYQL